MAKRVKTLKKVILYAVSFKESRRASDNEIYETEFISP